MQQVWTNFPDGDSRLQVLQAIAEAANEQGNCYPSLAQLAFAARMSRSSVWRALKRLRRERWIVTDRVLGRGRPHPSKSIFPAGVVGKMKRFGDQQVLLGAHAGDGDKQRGRWKTIDVGQQRSLDDAGSLDKMISTRFSVI